MSYIVRQRDEIPMEHTWDLESIFATEEEWEEAVGQLQGRLKEIERFKGRLAEGPDTLVAFLKEAEETQRLLGKIFVYASLNYSVDTTDQAAAARNDRARALFGMMMAVVSFAEPELLAIGFAALKEWLEQDERLAPYAHYLDQLEKRQDHVRSAEVEQVLGLARDAFGTASATHGILANADLTFTPAQDSEGETYEINQGLIGKLITHSDREVRRTAWEHYADGHLAFKNSMANMLAAGVKQDVFMTRVRGYASSLEASLASNFIPVEVFHNLIETFRRHLPTWHKYWRIRRQALGLDTLREYDIKAPLATVSPEIAYRQAVDWIAAGMKPLGAEYVDALRQGALQERWIDVYPNQGKRMGAFSAGVPGTYPFIMMSYNDDLYSLSTLAHELGHSMHSYYTWQNQEVLAYCRYSLFVAEVASNFNQAMVRDYLFKSQDDPDFQIAVIEEAMSNFHRYFFIMPTLSRFELEIHQRVERGEALSADGLIDLMAGLFQEGYGDEVEMDWQRTGITWAAFHTHLYRNFYTYQYATGISAAHALAEGVLNGAPNAVDNYLAFLKAGGSLYPLDALKLAGVDMTSPEPVEQTFGVLGRLVDRLERLI